MRKLPLPLQLVAYPRPAVLLILLFAVACGKSPNTPFYAASFSRTINGGAPWSWDFSNKTANLLSFTQTYYTGALTGGKQTRWTIAFVDPNTPVYLSMLIPGIDSSKDLPVGKDMSFSSTPLGCPWLVVRH